MTNAEMFEAVFGLPISERPSCIIRDDCRTCPGVKKVYCHRYWFDKEYVGTYNINDHIAYINYLKRLQND